jgi:hypothetical protein
VAPLLLPALTAALAKERLFCFAAEGGGGAPAKAGIGVEDG